jgi:hypothetical protein
LSEEKSNFNFEISYAEQNVPISECRVTRSEDIHEKLRGMKEKLIQENNADQKKLIEARKQLADQSNPYPHKLRD